MGGPKAGVPGAFQDREGPHGRRQSPAAPGGSRAVCLPHQVWEARNGAAGTVQEGRSCCGAEVARGRGIAVHGSGKMGARPPGASLPEGVCVCLSEWGGNQLAN